MKTLSPLSVQRALGIAAVCALLLMFIPPPTTAAPPRQSGTVVYYVQFGDTLFSIARRFSTTVPAIMAANGLVGDYIYVGQRLIVPIGVPPYYPPMPPPAGTNFACKYTVQPRDTVFSIAYRYKTTAYALMQANYLYTPYLFVGRQLNVPCLSPTPTPFPTYTVQSGDNLFRIAIKYSTTIYAIALVNGIPNPHLIYIGQALVIPYPGIYVWRTDIPPPPTRVIPTHIVIGEFRTRGPNGGNDEFIELFNPTNQTVDISGWLVKYSSASGAIETRVTIAGNISLPPGRHYLVANNASDGYSGSVTADQTYTTGIADDGGIALTQADGTIVDQVGMSTGSAFKEGTVLSPLTTNVDRSYERKPGGAAGNCYDTDNNASDFLITAPSAPQNLASAAILCTPTTPIPTSTATTTATPTTTATATATTTGVGGMAFVVMRTFAFEPSTLTVTRGTTVRWTNIDSITHTVTSGAPGALTNVFRSNQMAPGATFEFTFPNTGTFQYFCENHPQMTGTITVQ